MTADKTTISKILKLTGKSDTKSLDYLADQTPMYLTKFHRLCKNLKSLKK